MASSYRNSETPPPIMKGSPPALILPRADWDRPPWNRWSFQNVRQILPTAEVWRGNGPVKALARKERDLDGVGFAGADGTATSLAPFLDESYTDGFLVLKDGAIVCECYFNGMGERTLHLSQSVAKSVTAAAAGALVGKGLLDVSAPVTRYLPELERVPDAFIHAPWTMGPLEQQACGCVIGRDYPAPVVDHAAQRARALALYKAVRAP